MHIALINPPHPYLIQPDSQAPLGLMYLAAVLREAGHEATLSNLSRFPEHRAVERIPRDADVYGFTTTSIDYALCERLARRIKEFRDVPIILGGPHTTVAPDMVDVAAFDAICVGEGERVILDMVEDARRGELAGVYRGGRIIDLDALPPPARDLMDIVGGDIFAQGKHFAAFSKAGRCVSSVILTARGCPFDCAFCASRPVWGGRVIKRSVDSVLDEVRAVRDRFGVREFRFSDETMNLDRKRLAALCRGLEELGVFWRCSVRAGISGADDFKRMYDAGCREVSPGIESGDQRVLDLLGKGTTVTDNRTLVDLASAAGIHVRVLLMTGTPGESPNTPEITRDFLRSIDFHLVALTQFRPLPGTAIWRDPARFGCRIVDRDIEGYNFYFWKRGDDRARELSPVRAVIETDEMSKQALEDNMSRMRDYALETGRCNTG